MLISKTYKDLIKLNTKKKKERKKNQNNPIKKLEKDLNRLLQKGHTDGQWTYENMLNVTNHQRDVNRNHNEISPHTCQNG